MDYDLQSDEQEDESDKYYLLAKQHAEADVLARTLFPNGRLKVDSKPEVSVPSIEEPYKDFTPKFQPVPIPINADEKWQEVVARFQRLEEKALHGD
jgi:hypothetical protein